MFKIQESLNWIARALGVDRASAQGQDPDAPSVVLDTIQAGLEARGWLACAEIRTFNATAAGPTQSVAGPDVPAGEFWLVLACNVRHTDVTQRTVRIDLFNRQTPQAVKAVALTEVNVQIGNTGHVALLRPILLVPGCILSGEATSPIAATFNFLLDGHYVVLRPGEYIPYSPWS